LESITVIRCEDGGDPYSDVSAASQRGGSRILMVEHVLRLLLEVAQHSFWLALVAILAASIIAWVALLKG
jgi:hypothetical protein